MMYRILNAIPLPLDAIKFLLVGGVSTFFNFLILIILVELFDADPVFSSGLAYLSGGLVSYLMNYYMTFKSSKKHLDTLPKFIVVLLIGAAINTLVFKLVMLVISIYVLSQVMAVAIALVANYFLHKFWIYK